MAKISFAMYQAHQNGVSVETLASVLELPTEFVRERVEAARLSLLVQEDWF
jgi:hypothetical protein